MWGVEVGHERDGFARRDRIPPASGHLVDRLHDEARMAAAGEAGGDGLFAAHVEFHEPGPRDLVARRCGEGVVERTTEDGSHTDARVVEDGDLPGVGRAEPVELHRPHGHRSMAGQIAGGDDEGFPVFVAHAVMVRPLHLQGLPP